MITEEPRRFEQRPCACAAYLISSQRLSSQNPGRVVTLIHKEDWDKFSGSVRSSDGFTVACKLSENHIRRMRFRMTT